MADKFVCYADDSYVVVADNTLDEVQSRIRDISLRHIVELRRRGMKVNESKTEVLVFSKKGETIAEFDIAGTKVKSGTTMKALGVIFDNNLSWKPHIDNNINQSAWKLTVLRRIRHKFTFKQFTQILTAQFFSKLFYCSQTWLTSTTKRKLWNSINSLNYRAVRILVGDFKGIINREKLDHLSSRASPKQWSKYSIAAIVIKVLRDEAPVDLRQYLLETLFEERRKPGIGRFYDNSRGKIGRQKFGNNVQFMMAIRDPWLGRRITDDGLRTMLKRTFFPYHTN
jgi:hypothetical protein